MNRVWLTAYLGIFVLLMQCRSPAYISGLEQVGTNTYGAYIKIRASFGGSAWYERRSRSVKGELIAVNDTSLFVLTKEDNITQVQVIPVKYVHSFNALWAKPKQYGWTIPLFLGVSVSHGIFGPSTAIVNGIATTIITFSAEDNVEYTDNEIGYDELKMFARFPQGIPPGIALDQIR